YRDDRGLLQVPRTPFRAGEPVYKAETSTIQEVIGLEEDKKHGAYVGLLAGHNVPVYLDINAMVQKHVSILAKTGGGKSYVAGVLIEELMKHRVTSVILDPHGEYSSLREKGKHAEASGRFHVEPRAYGDIIQVFSPDTKINPGSRPLKFTLSNLDARDILSLTGSSKVRTHLADDARRRGVAQFLSSGRPGRFLQGLPDAGLGRPEVRSRPRRHHATRGEGRQERPQPVQHPDYPEGHEPE